MRYINSRFTYLLTYLLGRVFTAAYQVSVVSPDAELHLALLNVERKELDVDVTLAFVYGRRFPLDDSCVLDSRLCHHRYDVVAIGAARVQTNTDTGVRRISQWGVGC